MYQSLYTLITDLVFNGSMNAVQTEVVTWCATVASLAVVALPLVIVIRLIKDALGFWR